MKMTLITRKTRLEFKEWFFNRAIFRFRWHTNRNANIHFRQNFKRETPWRW